MQYIKKDTEHNNVYLTTDDNIGYKLGFVTGREKQLLVVPARYYLSPTVNINSVREKGFEDVN